jgi:acetyl-CoA synthetase
VPSGPSRPFPPSDLSARPQTAKETLYWHRDFETVRAGGFETGDIQWFPEGGLNAAYNCVDRWAFKHPDQTAILYEADEPGQSVNITYAELLREVSRVANVLKGWGVKKGDTVRLPSARIDRARGAR